MLPPATINVSMTGVAGPGEVTADLLGRGVPQVVRIVGSRVEIVAAESEGGEVLVSFEAGTDLTWPACDRPMDGQEVLRAVGHPASRVAVVGGRIAVSTVHCAADLRSDSPTGTRGASSVALYDPFGRLVTRRTFPDAAATALDGISVRDADYLAIGLSHSGVRVVRADFSVLPDHHAVPADWRRRAPVRRDREIVTAVRFGRTEDGRVVLVSGSLTADGAAVVVTDVAQGHLLWCDNYLSDEPLRDRPTSIEVGRFGPAGVPTVSVAWSSGRLTLHDAARGTRPFIEEGRPENPVVAQRFVLGDRGRRLLAVRRRVGAALLAAGAGSRLVEVRPHRRNGEVVGAH